MVNPTPGQFVASLFLVPKKEGVMRPVVNIKPLNKHIPYHKFQLETMNQLKDTIEPGDYLTKIDVKDAYFSMALRPESRKFGSVSRTHCTNSHA